MSICPYKTLAEFEAALAKAGGPTRLAGDLDVSRGAVWGWRQRLTRAAGAPPSPPRPVSPQLDSFRKRVAELERDNAALRELADSIRKAATNEAVYLPPPTIVHSIDGPRFATPVEIVLHISDIQYGEVVHSEDVPGGLYSPAIFREERLPRYVEAACAILEAVAQQHPLARIWIALGGDLAEGHNVFEGQPWHLAMDAGAQIVSLSARLAPAIARIASVAKALGSPSVAVLNVVGNHGVPGGRKAGAVPASLSYDYLASEMIRLRLEAMPERGWVDFYDEQPRRAVYFEAAGHTILLSHGDQDRGGGLIGVAAVTGLKNDLAVRVQTGLNHRYHLKGHYHRPTSITVGGDSQTLWNGDWCGANNLSVGKGGGSEPTQRAYVLHPDYGISQEWPIRLAPGMSRRAPAVIDLAA